MRFGAPRQNPKAHRVRAVHLAIILAILPNQLNRPITGSSFADEPGEKQKEQSVNPATEKQHTNRLIHATSPYLLQHAHNPIDWYQWGDEAFEKAVNQDKPIFLSIGYAACHWCHVMEHESFEDQGVADYLNANFINIKVDRQERPDVDEIYMHVTQVMNQGGGGWPMSLFLMPDRRPIVARTYLPREMLLQLAELVHEKWTNQRDLIEQHGDQLLGIVQTWARGVQADESLPTIDIVDQTARDLALYTDLSRGGFKTDGNKFPPSMAMELMLRVHRRNGDPRLLDAVKATLEHMACGGIYDHIGGGICRYSTDPDWLVPHFEKMLYDQALVSSIYLDAYQVTGDRLYAHTAADIFDYVLADLQSPEGGFYSTRDADSEGLEGAYYIWTVDQVREALGPDEAELFCKYYDVTETGNWFERHGHAPPGPKNILHVTKPPEVFARLHHLDEPDLRARIDRWRERLAAIRSKRVPPALDDKILTGWNGLMIASLAKGARTLDEPKYAAAAGRAADFVLQNLRKDGRLLRTYRSGTAHLTGYLTDYAFFIEGLLNLYEATFDQRWLEQAAELTDVLIAHYADNEGGGFFFSADDGDKLIARPKNPRDGAIPSGNSVAAADLIRLARFLDRKGYNARAESIFRSYKPMLDAGPYSFERLLCALDMYYDSAQEIALVSAPGAQDLAPLIREVFGRYLPNKVVAFAASNRTDKSLIPWLEGKSARDGSATAYVCENYVCKRPVTKTDDLRILLAPKSANGADKSDR